MELQTEKAVTKDQIEVGSSFSLYPHNSKEDVDFVIQQFKWHSSTLIGNNTVEQLLTNEIDIRSEKLKLSKFMSEYNLQYIQEDVLNHPYLTLLQLAKYSEKLPEIPYSILEDNIPKIKPRHYSITNDPFYDLEAKKSIE